MPLLGHADRERTYTLASTVAVEHAIAELAELCRGQSLSPSIPDDAVAEAIGGLEERRGHRLTAGQAETVRHLCGSRRRLDIVVGHAGTGKTTALAAVQAAHEGAGWTVLGTSTSGQAARALEAEADVPSRTLASLRWQAEHGRIRFGRKTAIILDEAGMADDPDLLWLLGQVATAGGRLIIVGDHRQLDAVGPGGGLRAIIERGDAHELDEIVRQADPAERRALAEVREGDVAVAAAFYRNHRRIHAFASWEATVSAATEAWVGDVAQGRNTVLLAWRCADVDGLNQAARQRMVEVGRLQGPSLVAGGGRSYQAGDAVIALAPLANRSLVTSERATVTGVDLERGRLAVRTGDGRAVLLERPDLAADRLAHGYAITVHRSQGATFDTATSSPAAATAISPTLPSAEPEPTRTCGARPTRSSRRSMTSTTTGRAIGASGGPSTRGPRPRVGLRASGCIPSRPLRSGWRRSGRKRRPSSPAFRGIDPSCSRARGGAWERSRANWRCSAGARGREPPPRSGTWPRRRRRRLSSAGRRQGLPRLERPAWSGGGRAGTSPSCCGAMAPPRRPSAPPSAPTRSSWEHGQPTCGRPRRISAGRSISTGAGTQPGQRSGSASTTSTGPSPPSRLASRSSRRYSRWPLRWAASWTEDRVNYKDT